MTVHTKNGNVICDVSYSFIESVSVLLDRVKLQHYDVEMKLRYWNIFYGQIPLK